MTRDELLEEIRHRSNGKIRNFRDGQWGAIDAVANQGRRQLVVQRTGWGKSVVYFGATIILREEGAGPTLVISPLLALVRDQIRAAEEDFGLTARSYNHQNESDWRTIQAELNAGEVDVLFLTPQKTANDEFLSEYVLPYVDGTRLLVVDEAHCVSTWGHSFMPDYQRIRRLMADRLPEGIGVLATTATADDTVVVDVMRQLGEGTQISRGALSRDSLHLQTINIPSRAERYAWLVQALRQLEGSGIIYTLTKRDAERVANWLKANDIDVEPYHSGIGGADEEGEVDARRELEERLRRNEIKALVATTALGMGYDKPDLAFVIHYQAPQSVIQYYQQVGRAGRALDDAYGILLAGEEDENVINFFIDNAFPREQDVRSILEALEDAEQGLTVTQIMQQVDLPKGRIENALRIEAVRDQPPVYKEDRQWVRSIHDYEPDYVTIAAVTARQRQQWAQMRAYINADRCLMRFLAEELDDDTAGDCGRCAVCVGRPILPRNVPPALVQRAVNFIRQHGMAELELPKQWPADALPTYGWRGNIRPALSGRALSIWGDPGWAELVKSGKDAGHFDDDLVDAAADFIRNQWGLPLDGHTPLWLTCIPSLRRPTLVADFGRRLAERLGIEFTVALEKVRDTRPQKEMVNRFHQARNLDGAFSVVDSALRQGPVLLLDDIADSGWSLTICAHLLHEGGSEVVYPFALSWAKSVA